MLEYYDRILAIYMPAAELYFRCTQPRVRVVTSNSTALPAS